MLESVRPTSPRDGLHARWVFVLTLALSSIGEGCRAHNDAAPIVADVPVRGGLTIVHQDGTSPLQTFYVDSDRIRVESAGWNSVVIVDARAQRVLYVFGDERTYEDLGPKEVEFLKATLPPWLSKEDLEQLNQEAERLPAKEREAARSTIDLMAGGDFSRAFPHTFERTTAKRTINGIACDVYRVSLGGEPFTDECISPWSDGIFRREDFAPLAVYYRSIKSLGVPGDTIFSCLDSYPGFPMAQTLVRPALNNSTNPGNDLPPWETKSVKRSPLPASLFTAPPGFTKRKLRIPSLPPADPGPPMNR